MVVNTSRMMTDGHRDNSVGERKLIWDEENRLLSVDDNGFVSNLIKSAKKRIVLIDNYVDETVLTLLDKRENSVSAVIYTQQISRQFKLDIDRHNAQYAPIDVETFRLSHDRFLCIDDDVYHIGASIKDLGKKWFGFSKMEILTPDELVERINRE